MKKHLIRMGLGLLFLMGIVSFCLLVLGPAILSEQFKNNNYLWAYAPMGLFTVWFLGLALEE